MLPVFGIEEKVCSCFERLGFVHSRYGKTKVVNYRFIVCVQYTSASSFVVETFCEKFGGKMVVRVACYFDNKGCLSCYDLSFDVVYTKEFLPRCLICDALFSYLRHTDA